MKDLVENNIGFKIGGGFLIPSEKDEPNTEIQIVFPNIYKSIEDAKKNITNICAKMQKREDKKRR